MTTPEHMPLTDEELEALSKSTPGPWHWEAEDSSMVTLYGPDLPEQQQHVLTVTICSNCAKDEAHWAWGRCYTAKAPDAALIVAAPRLLAELRLYRTKAEASKGDYTKQAGDFVKAHPDICAPVTVTFELVALMSSIARDAIEKERERCAGIAATKFDDFSTLRASFAGDEIAAAIRDKTKDEG